MRFVAVIVAAAVLCGACSASGGQELVVGEAALAGEEEAQPAAENTVGASVGDEFCDVSLQLGRIELVTRRSWRGGVFGDLDRDMLRAWSDRHLRPQVARFARVLPPSHDEVRRAFELLLSLDPDDPVLSDADLERELLAANGIDADRVETLMAELAAASEDRCGTVEELSLVELDLDEVAAHVTRVAGEVWLDPDDAMCVAGPDVVDRIEGWLLEPPPDPAAELAAVCALDSVDAAVFTWRLGDVRLRLSPYEDIDLLTIEPPIVIEEYLGPPEVEPPVETGVDPAPTPEVYAYPIEGLVLDVLGTLGIADVQCLIEAGVYEPAQLWFDDPGTDPEILAAQRQQLEAAAMVCGFTAADVDAWLALGYQFLAEVEG